MDFRVPGLSHAIVKEAQHFRVQKLVQKIESHPHREALQADLQHNSVYNPFRNNSKAMIRQTGNVELFELLEAIPKVQYSECFLHWNQEIEYCTCEQYLNYNESRSKFFTNLDWMHSLSRTTWSSKDVVGIHDRFRRSCLSWITIRHRMDRKKVQRDGWTCKKKTVRVISLERNIQDTKENGISPITSRARMGLWDFDPILELLSISKNRQHHESGEQVEKPFSPEQNSFWHPSSSTLRWKKNWKWAHKINSKIDENFCCSRFLLPLTSHVIFLMRIARLWLCPYVLHGWNVCERAAFHLHVVHDKRLIVRSSLLLRSVFLRVSLWCLLLLFLVSLVLWPSLLLWQLQGKHPLRFRSMRSIAPWRYTSFFPQKQPGRYTTLHHLKYMEKSPMKSRPDLNETTQADICMNWGSTSKSTTYMSLWSSRSSNGFFFAFTQLERIHTKASSNIKRSRRSVSQRRRLREIEKPPLTLIDGKAIDGTSTRKKDQDGQRVMKSENFKGVLDIRSPNPDCELKNLFFFSQDGHGVMSFFSQISWRVSYTCSCNYSVYDGVYMYSPVTRTFFCCTVCLLTSAHLHACAHTRIAQVSWKRCLFHVCFRSFSRFLRSHVAPIFAVPALSLRYHSWLRLHWRSRPHVLVVFDSPRNEGHAQIRTSTEEFGCLAITHFCHARRDTNSTGEHGCSHRCSHRQVTYHHFGDNAHVRTIYEHRSDGTQAWHLGSSHPGVRDFMVASGFFFRQGPFWVPRWFWHVCTRRLYHACLPQYPLTRFRRPEGTRLVDSPIHLLLSGTMINCWFETSWWLGGMGLRWGSLSPSVYMGCDWLFGCHQVGVWGWVRYRRRRWSLDCCAPKTTRVRQEKNKSLTISKVSTRCRPGCDVLSRIFFPDGRCGSHFVDARKSRGLLALTSASTILLT